MIVIVIGKTVGGGDDREQRVPDGRHGRSDAEEEGVDRPEGASHRDERDGLVHDARHQEGADQ